MDGLQKAEKLQRVFETEKVLNGIRDSDVLLERILTEARAIANADAGSIYVIEDKQRTPNSISINDTSAPPAFQDKILRIKYAQNDTQLKKAAFSRKSPYVYFTIPIARTSISGYVACTGEVVNIPDAYAIPKESPFQFNNSTDISTGYVTTSVLTIPLKTNTEQILGVLQIINAKDPSGAVVPFSDESVEFIRQFAASATQSLEHTYIINDMIRRMQRMAEFRDPKETGTHVERVSDFSIEIYDQWAENAGVPNAERMKFRDTLKIAAKCHDLGKVGISDTILKIPRLFTPEERAVIQGHTCIGATLFTPPESDLDEMSRDVALHHHEWWDGSERGYPGAIDFESYHIGEPLPAARPLAGTEIPLAARIVAVADVFDALSHQRVYKKAWSIDDAFVEIQSLSGKQFDPELVLAFVQVRDRIISINTAYEKRDA